MSARGRIFCSAVKAASRKALLSGYAIPGRKTAGPRRAGLRSFPLFCLGCHLREPAAFWSCSTPSGGAMTCEVLISSGPLAPRHAPQVRRGSPWGEFRTYPDGQALLPGLQL